MKRLVVALAFAIALVGCSEAQKEDVTKVTEDMTGITTVKKGQKAIDDLEAIRAADSARVNEATAIGDYE